MSAKVQVQVGLEDGWIKKTQMSLEMFTELWKSPMELKCLVAFVFPHWASLDLQASGYLWQSAHCFLRLFYLSTLSLSKIISWTGTYWNSSSCMLTLLSVSSRRKKYRKRGEGDQGKGRKEGGSSGLLSSIDVSTENDSPTLQQQLPLLVQCVWTLSFVCQWALPHAQAVLNPKGYFG